jgi:hypothetical protein
MKFKIGDKVMLKAVPYSSFTNVNDANLYYNYAKNKANTITKFLLKRTVMLSDSYGIDTKYLKHAVKPKAVKYEIDCSNLNCTACPRGACEEVDFQGTKSQVEAHIKRYWKQPKIKAVVK